MTRMMRISDDLHAKINASARPGEAMGDTLARLLADHNPYAGHTEALAEVGLNADALDHLYADDAAAHDRFTGEGA